MFDNIKPHINIMSKMGINANQYLLCILLYCDDRKNGKFIKSGADISDLYRYASSTHWKIEEINELIDKGLIADKNRPGKDRSADLLEITPLFEEEVFANINRFEQLWALYPPVVTTFEGKKFILRSCDKEELEELYYKKVKTKALHETILKRVIWAKENNQLYMSIDKFVKGNGWEIFDALQQEYDENKGNATVA